MCVDYSENLDYTVLTNLLGLVWSYGLPLWGFSPLTVNFPLLHLFLTTSLTLVQWQRQFVCTRAVSNQSMMLKAAFTSTYRASEPCGESENPSKDEIQTSISLSLLYAAQMTRRSFPWHVVRHVLASAAALLTLRSRHNDRPIRVKQHCNDMTIHINPAKDKHKQQ